jgi:hypothetical protein
VSETSALLNSLLLFVRRDSSRNHFGNRLCRHNDMSGVGCHPRIEDPDKISFLTTRSRNSELWFINNVKLEHATLGYLAKFAARYGTILYAFAIEGNHDQGVTKHPNCNRSDFMRDLNSSIARAVPRYVEEYPGGRFWGRRYSQEFIPNHTDDIEARFFYTVLQPVQDGLVPKISEYPGYNCFDDAIHGIERKFKVINWGKYNAAKKKNPKTPIKKYIEVVTLKYDRIPGYEHLSVKEYAELMKKKLEVHRQQVIADREARGLKSFLGREALLRMKPGSRPKKTKTSTIKSNRPRVLSVCLERWKDCMNWYFSKYFSYKYTSKQYRSGNLNIRFPAGMYLPMLKCRIVSSP